MDHKKVGTIEFGGAFFQAEFNDAIIRGDVSAMTGTFGGKLTAEAIDAVDNINIAGNAVGVGYHYEIPYRSFSVRTGVSEGRTFVYNYSCSAQSTWYYMHHVLGALTFTVDSSARNGADVYISGEINGTNIYSSNERAYQDTVGPRVIISPNSSATITSGTVNYSFAGCPQAGVHFVSSLGMEYFVGPSAGAFGAHGRPHFFSEGTHTLYVVTHAAYSWILRGDTDRGTTFSGAVGGRFSIEVRNRPV